MNATAVSAEALGKRYVLRHDSVRGGYSTLREKIADRAVSLARGFLGRGGGIDPAAGPLREDFWALRDVSFSIEQGEVVGLIGSNGAGKSTLLKLVSRITEPTEGSLRIRGRVASLLEVGTGFHPELTGRENIFLNGAVLGMARREILRQFDRIVEFSEVERFLDTPIKRYSSGMYVRLAFAISAHLDSEIMLVDEVLAVGDVAFQRKCIQRMQDLVAAGRTLLFVSHNLGLIRQLCRRGILIESGRIVCDDEAGAAVDEYLRRLEPPGDGDLLGASRRSGSGGARLARIELEDASGRSVVQVESGQPLRLVFQFTGASDRLACSFTLYDELGQAIASCDSALLGSKDSSGPPGRPSFVCEIPALYLLPGRYRIDAALASDDKVLDYVEGAGFLEVATGVIEGRSIHSTPGYGHSFLPHRWTRPA